MKTLVPRPTWLRRGFLSLATCTALFVPGPHCVVSAQSAYAGSLVLTTNAATGATTINAGTLQLGSATVTNASPVTLFTGTTAASAITTGAGATLTINPGTAVTVAGERTASGVTIDSSVYRSGTLQIDSGSNLNGSGTLTLNNGQVNTSGAVTIPVRTVNGALFVNSPNLGSANAITFTNPISLGLTKTGAGTLVLNSGSLYSGSLNGGVNAVVLNGALVLDTLLYTPGTPPTGDYGTPTTDSPASTGEAQVASNTQAETRGAFVRSGNLQKVRVEYGLNQTYGTIQIVTNVTQPTYGDGQPAFFTVKLDWLQPATTYHYRTKVIETITTTEGGTTTETVTRYGEDRTFTTPPMLARGPVWCTGERIVFDAVQLASASTARFSGTPHIVAVTPGARGATATDGTNVAYAPDASFRNEDTIRVKIGFTAQASNVNPYPAPAPYAFEVKILRPALPEVVTGDAIVGSNSDVQLNGTFAANGPSVVAGFDYGTDETYGTTVNTSSLAYGGGFSIPPSIVLTKLAPATTFHYRAWLQNALGTALGEDRTFTTPAAVDGGGYLTDAGGVTFDPFARIVVPWEVPPAAQSLAPQAASFGSSSSVIIIGGGTGSVKVVAGVTQGAHGTATYTGSSVSYVPGPTFTGSDSFLYRVADGRLTLSTFGQLPANVPFWVRVNIHSPLGLAEVRAVKGGAVPDTAFTFASLTSAGSRAFGGAVNGDAGSIPAIFGADGSVKIKVGDPAPGLATSSIATLKTPSGQAALATLKTGVAGVTAATDCVLLGGLDSAPRIAAREGQALDNAPTLAIKSFGALDGEGGVIFFLATLRGSGITSASDLALCAALADGSVRLLVREGQEVNGVKLKIFATLVGAAGTLAENRWRAGDAAIGIRATFATGVQALFRIPADAATPADWTSLARSGGPLDPGAPGNIRSFGLPAFSENGVAFRASLTGSAGTAIAVANGGSATVRAWKEFVPRTWDPSTNLPTFDNVYGATYATFDDPVAGANGRVAFRATMAGSGISAANRTGIWYFYEGGKAKLLALAGDIAPGGGRWATFTSLSLRDGATRGPLITGTLLVNAADQVTAKDNVGLWSADHAGRLTLLLRTGQTMDLAGAPKTIASFAALTPADDSIPLLVTFTDRTVAVVNLRLP